MGNKKSVPSDNQQNDETILQELASLDRIAYDRSREIKADELGIRVSTLDAEVESRRSKSMSNIDCQEYAIEPWEEPVDGADLADFIYEDITTHIVLPESSAVAITIWILLTYVFDAFRILPILALLSPEKRCGKTTLLLLLNGLVNNGRLSSNISPAAVFRIIEKEKPTMLTDEADTFFKNSDELRGIYNSGHTRESAYVERVNKDTMEVERFSTWSPKALAMIGRLPDTITDRSIIVDMSRKRSGEKVQKKKLSHYEDNIPVRRKAIRWAADNFLNLSEFQVEMPDYGNDRMVDNWTPIYTISLVIGNGWEEKTLKAMKTSAAVQGDDDSAGSMLLEDIRSVFKEIGSDRISSEDLVQRLVSMDDRPWPEWKRGNPITKAGLARLLKRFNVKAQKVRFGEYTLQGYHLEQFKDCFSRYIHPFQSGTPEQSNNIN